MAFGRFDRGADQAPISDINMTPLIDVMLVLLVIFILTAPLLTGHIALRLPRTAAPPAPRPASSLDVSLRRDGALFLDGAPVAGARLAQRLADAARRAPDTELRVRADTAVPYGRVAAVLAEAQRAGLRNIGLITAPEPASRRGLAPARGAGD